MEKATGCSSLSVNIHQKKRVRFFLDTVGWEGGLLKLQSLPCLAGKVLPWAGGSRHCLEAPCACLLALPSPASAPSSSLQPCCLAFGLCQRDRGCCQSPGGPVGVCVPGGLGDPFLERAPGLRGAGEPLSSVCQPGEVDRARRGPRRAFGISSHPESDTSCLKAVSVWGRQWNAGAWPPSPHPGKHSAGACLPQGCSCRAADPLPSLAGFVVVLVRFAIRY